MPSSLQYPLILLLAFLCLHISSAEIICKDLPKEICAFSVAGSGKRCSLETSSWRKWKVDYQCSPTEMLADKISNYVESEKCIRACGVDRMTLGISSDKLLEPPFVANLCSPQCYYNCPNIVDFYFNLAAEKGAFLPDLCEAKRNIPRRSVLGFLSFGAAPSPTPSPSVAPASGPSMLEELTISDVPPQSGNRRSLLDHSDTHSNTPGGSSSSFSSSYGDNNGGSGSAGDSGSSMLDELTIPDVQPQYGNRRSLLDHSDTHSNTPGGSSSSFSSSYGDNNGGSGSAGDSGSSMLDELTIPGVEPQYGNRRSLLDHSDTHSSSGDGSSSSYSSSFGVNNGKPYEFHETGSGPLSDSLAKVYGASLNAEPSAFHGNSFSVSSAGNSPVFKSTSSGSGGEDFSKAFGTSFAVNTGDEANTKPEQISKFYGAVNNFASPQRSLLGLFSSDSAPAPSADGPSQLYSETFGPSSGAPSVFEEAASSPTGETLSNGNGAANGPTAGKAKKKSIFEPLRKTLSNVFKSITGRSTLESPLSSHRRFLMGIFSSDAAPSPNTEAASNGPSAGAPSIFEGAASSPISETLSKVYGSITGGSAPKSPQSSHRRSLMGLFSSDAAPSPNTAGPSQSNSETYGPIAGEPSVFQEAASSPTGKTLSNGYGAPSGSSSGEPSIFEGAATSPIGETLSKVYGAITGRSADKSPQSSHRRSLMGVSSPDAAPSPDASPSPDAASSPGADGPSLLAEEATSSNADPPSQDDSETSGQSASEPSFFDEEVMKPIDDTLSKVYGAVTGSNGDESKQSGHGRSLLAPSSTDGAPSLQADTPSVYRPRAYNAFADGLSDNSPFSNSYRSLLGREVPTAPMAEEVGPAHLPIIDGPSEVNRSGRRLLLASH